MFDPTKFGATVTGFDPKEEEEKFDPAKFGGKVSGTDGAIQDIKREIEAPEARHPILDFFTGSTQKFAKTLGAAGVVATGTAADIDRSSVAEADARLEMAKQLKTATPEQAARIRSQLGQAPSVGVATEQIGDLNKTAKQVFGEGLGTGLEAVSGGTLGKVTRAPTLGKAVLKGIGTGGIYGLLAGTSEAMQEDRGAKDIAKSAALGGTAGAALGGALGAVGHALTPKTLSAKSEDIYRKVLKMTPQEIQKEAAQGKNTPVLLKELGLSGTREEIQATLSEILEAKNDDMQKLLTERAAAGATVSTDEFEKAALASLDQYRTHVAEYGSIKDKVETIIENTRKLFGDDIPVDVANQIKQGLWKDSFNKAGTEVVNDAIYEAGSAMRQLIEAAVPDKDVAGLNAKIGQFIVANKQLDRSVSRQLTGKMSKYLGAILGLTAGTTGGPLGAVGGAVAGSQIDKVLSSSTLRTAIAALMEKAANAAPKAQNEIAGQVKDLVLRHLLMQSGEAAASGVQGGEGRP